MKQPHCLFRIPCLLLTGMLLLPLFPTSAEELVLPDPIAAEAEAPPEDARPAEPTEFQPQETAEEPVPEETTLPEQQLDSEAAASCEPTDEATVCPEEATLFAAERSADTAFRYEVNAQDCLQTVTNRKSWYEEPTCSAPDPVTDADGNTTLTLEPPDGWYAGIGISGELYAEQYEAAYGTACPESENPFYGLYRQKTEPLGNLVDSTVAAQREYEEYRFQGWQFTDAQGQQHCIPPHTPLQLDPETGCYCYADADGETYPIPADTTFTGSWTQISAPVGFWVNYSGTILDLEGDVAGRDTRNFTSGVALGWIFFGDLLSSEDANHAVGTDQLYADEINRQINQYFTSRQDLTLDGTSLQIYITHVIDANGTTYEAEKDSANTQILVDSTLDYLKTTNQTITVRTTEGTEARLDADLADLSHYDVRWYVCKEQSDFYHIDGVLVANTAQLTVTKSFKGLTEAEIQQVLASYEIEVHLGASRSNLYLQLTAADGGDFYTYTYDPEAQTARWVVTVIRDEEITLTEQQYALSHYQVEESSLIDYQTNSLYHGNTAGAAVAAAEQNPCYDICGGRTHLAAFQNLYRNASKGSFTLIKRDRDTGSVLQGVAFTLQGNGTTSTVTTDANGCAVFSELDGGLTYTLRETLPPGYQKEHTDYEDTYNLKLTKDKKNRISGMELYVYKTNGQRVTLCRTDSNSLSYTLNNVSTQNTLQVTKRFAGLTTAQVEQLKRAGFHLEIEGQPQWFTLDGAGETQAPSSSSPDGFTYQWMIEDIGSETLHVTERNFYADAIKGTLEASASFSMDGETIQPDVSNDGTAIRLCITTNEAATNRLELSNTYTNQFTLDLRKQDAQEHVPLSGAAFAVYVPYELATDATRSVVYDGRRYYYRMQTACTDTSGTVSVSGLPLPSDGTTATYLLEETATPTGYEAAKGKLFAVTVDARALHNGHLLQIIPNSKPMPVPTGIRRLHAGYSGGIFLLCSLAVAGIVWRRYRRKRQKRAL